MHNIKLCAKIEKEYRQWGYTVKNIGMEFTIEKCDMLVMRSSKQHTTEGIEQPDQENSECSEKRKLTNTRESWKRTP